MNVIGYARVVPDEAREAALEHQMQRLKAYCLANDLTFTKCFTEIVGGDVPLGNGRPGLLQAIDDCQPADMILVVRLDRLSSQKKLVTAIFDHCQGKNITVRAVAGPQTPDEIRNSLEVTVQAG